MNEQCPLCSAFLLSDKTTTIQEICDDCADVLEFGYPSFPAYPLEG